MRKVVKPLRMNNGVMARTIEEVKNNFDIKKILAYYLDGELKNWLEARCYEKELEKVNDLVETDPDVAKKLCDIFEVAYVEEQGIDVETIQNESERLSKLKQFTEDEEILASVNQVAFNQEELIELYEKGIERIYLCAGDFKIPEEKVGLDYVEVGDASVEYAITVRNLSLPESLADLIGYEYTELKDFILWRVYDDDKKSELYQAFFKDKNKKDDMTGNYYVWNFKKDEYSSFNLPHNLDMSRLVPTGNKIVYAFHGFGHDDERYSIKLFNVESKELRTIWKSPATINTWSLSNIYDNQIYFENRWNGKILLDISTGKHKIMSNSIDYLVRNKGINKCGHKIEIVELETENKEEITNLPDNICNYWLRGDEYFIRTYDSIIGLTTDKIITKYCDTHNYNYSHYWKTVSDGYSAQYKVFYEESNSFLKRLYIFDNQSKKLQSFAPESSFYIDGMQIYLVNHFLYFKNKFTQYRIDLSKEIEIVKVNPKSSGFISSFLKR